MDKCQAENCDAPIRARGLCNRHYRQLLHSERGECNIEGCTTKWHASGLCVKHYSRLRSWGTTADPDPLPLRGTCIVAMCTEAVKARSLCQMHLQRWYRNGTTDWVNKPHRSRERTCRFCKEKLASEKFPLSRASVCEDCIPAYRADRYARRLPNTAATRHRKEELRIIQDYRCAICNVHEKDAPKGTLHLDHCAETGELRELLCSQCNNAIGLLKHNPELLQAAIDYLRKYQSSSSSS